MSQPNKAGTLRLWDKDFNLIYTGRIDEPIHYTVWTDGLDDSHYLIESGEVLFEPA